MQELETGEVELPRRSLIKRGEPHLSEEDTGCSPLMCLLILLGVAAIVICYNVDPPRIASQHPNAVHPPSTTTTTIARHSFAMTQAHQNSPKGSARAEAQVGTQQPLKVIRAPQPPSAEQNSQQQEQQQNLQQQQQQQQQQQPPTQQQEPQQTKPPQQPDLPSKEKPALRTVAHATKIAATKSEATGPPKPPPFVVSTTLCPAVRDSLLQAGHISDSTLVQMTPVPVWTRVSGGEDLSKVSTAVAKGTVCQDDLAKDKECWASLDSKDPTLLDIWLLLNVFRLPSVHTPGHFVEYPSGDGLAASPSYLFETQLNWTGLCVEPNAQTCGFLRHGRPHCQVSCEEMGAQKTSSVAATLTKLGIKRLSLVVLRCSDCAFDALEQMFTAQISVDAILWKNLPPNATEVDRVSRLVGHRGMALVDGVVGGTIFLGPPVVVDSAPK